MGMIRKSRHVAHAWMDKHLNGLNFHEGVLKINLRLLNGVNPYLAGRLPIIYLPSM
jgi:hypothetical protein